MDYYDEIASGYEELHKEEQLKKLAFISKCIEENPELKDFISPEYTLLDVGCGSGISTEFFDAKERFGIDASRELIKIASMKSSQTRYIIARAENIPFLNKEFDIIISITALQNFDNIERSLLQMKGIGKRFILTFLKKSGKRKLIEDMIEKHFKIIKKFEQEKDIVYFCR